MISVVRFTEVVGINYVVDIIGINSVTSNAHVPSDAKHLNSNSQIHI